MVRKGLKLTSLALLKGTGMFHLLRNSRWRQRRLLILCYHGISLEDEHLWRPQLYMTPELLEQRLNILKRGGYNVLPLPDALRWMYADDLPPRSVALTFDDGLYDFYQRAFQVLKSFGFPVTVYQTTYYSGYSRPVFNLICSYLLWKHGGVLPGKGRELGLDVVMDLRTEAGRKLVTDAILSKAHKEALTSQGKDELVAQLAKLLGIDYDEVLAKRILQLMSGQEIKQLASEGVDFQLHTHRHRTPNDERLFRREIRENRESLHQATGSVAVHFCYPSGNYKKEFLSWLQEEMVISATTCEGGLATADMDRFLLPRFIDTSSRTTLEFEGWLAGVRN
jgi:peptidoglycan/xylan/chitin deacetylase (PgdA/CDA1 family)